MPKREKLELCNESVRLTTTKADLKKVAKLDLVRMLFIVHLVRQFETYLLKLQENGLVHGPVHTSIGQEAISAALSVLLKSNDWVGSTHRSHGHFISKAVMHYEAENFNPLKRDLNEAAQDAVNRTLAEIMGLKMGWCGGRGGSMHLFDEASGNLGSNAIVGGGIPLATGAALAQQMKKTGSIVVSIFGDGAFNQGCFHEVANMASLWQAPVLYLLENNGYAVATKLCEASCCNELALRALGYNFNTTVLDGMDPVAMYVGLRKIFSDMRHTPGPHLCEAMTYRFTHHAGPMPGSMFGYREKDEETDWQGKDPVKQFARLLIETKIITKKEDERLCQMVIDIMEKAQSFCTSEKDATLSIPDSYWPEPESIVRDVRSDGSEINDLSFIEQEDVDKVQTTTYVEAIAAVTHRQMEKDDRVFIMGEEVGHFQGGVYGASRGAAKSFPDRVFNTPISEAGFVGMGGGAASVGMRPIVEIMFPDFALVAADQMFNQIGKLRHMYGGQVRFPLILRTRVALGQGYGGQHSMNPSGFFGMFSGWRVVAPANAFDYIGLFNTAMQIEDPVVIIEHADLYATDGLIPENDLDYFVAYGKAKIVRPGDDLTILTYSITVSESLKAAEALDAKGISVEVIDLRTLDYQGMDYETIGNSIRKTGRVLIVEQNPRSLGISARLADEIQERHFADLSIPIERLTSADVPPPVSKALESLMLVKSEEISAKAEAVANRQAVCRTQTYVAAVASPLAKKEAKRVGIDINQVSGTGPRGKIYRADVVEAASGETVAASPASGASFAEPAERPSRLEPFDGMRKAIADRMAASKFTAPHLYFFANVNMDKVMAFKNDLSSVSKGEVRISVNDIFIKLTALTLKRYPNLNATVEGDAIRLWDNVNIGLAVALDDGLIVPAVPAADALRFHEIAAMRKDLVEKARAGKLSPDEMSRGTFTISSLARSNITHFTAIINPPQTAILSVGPTQERPVVENGELKVGRVATLGLSVDHRVVDGKVAAGFLSELTDFLENAPQKIISYY
jgi:2-oxoisovalerate dehydrogenase E1 component